MACRRPALSTTPPVAVAQKLSPNMYKTLAAFPVERFLDYPAIQSIFEMQDALQLAINSLIEIGAGGKTWHISWDAQKTRIKEAHAQADVSLLR